MRTRGTGLSPDHVYALNLIEVEFFGDSQVVDAWKSYLDALQPQYNENGDLRNRRLVGLLQAMAKNLKIPMEQLDIMDNHYVPQGWADAENRRLAIEEEALKVLIGNKGLKIETD